MYCRMRDEGVADRGWRGQAWRSVCAVHQWHADRGHDRGRDVRCRRKGMPSPRSSSRTGGRTIRPKDGRKPAAATGGGNALSMASRFSPADRKRLDAEKKSFEEKNDREKTAFETALKAMRSSAALDERVEAGLKALRTGPIEIDNDFKPWASIIRELIEIGKPAVPKLTAELDRTEQDKMLRNLGFVLRGIGDPRARWRVSAPFPGCCKIPATTGFPSRVTRSLRNSCGSTITSTGESRGNPPAGLCIISYGTPLREIMPALEKITGRGDAWRELRFVYPGGGREQQRLQAQALRSSPNVGPIGGRRTGARSSRARPRHSSTRPGRPWNRFHDRFPQRCISRVDRYSRAGPAWSWKEARNTAGHLRSTNARRTHSWTWTRGGVRIRRRILSRHPRGMSLPGSCWLGPSGRAST